MSSQVIVYLGPARSGKTAELLRQYAAALKGGPNRFGATLWLAPTARNAAQVREQLVASGAGGCFNPGVMTFLDFARRVLAACPSRLRGIDATIERELLRRVVRAASGRGELVFYAQAADRPGFIELLADHIRELKRRDILPLAFAKARVPNKDPRQQQELAQLYADYQQQLTTHSLVDDESAHWAARDAFAARTCAAFQSLDLVVVDGFTDFTRTQHEILALLAGRTKQLLVALQSDERPAREDLFAKTTATLATLRRHHPRLDERPFAPERSSWPAHEYLLRNLFRVPGAAPPMSPEVLGSLERFEIVAAASAHDEILQIARRIKRLLSEEEARPSDVLVVFRTLLESAARIREVFGQFDIPFYLERGEPVATAAVCKTLQALLRLDCDDWPFRAVVSVITNRQLTAIDEGSRRAADWLVRDLQVAKGRRALVERVAQLAESRAVPGELSRNAERRVEQARKALPALSQLAAALDELPQDATATDWQNALAQLAHRLGFLSLKWAPIYRGDQSLSRDQLAWERICEHVSSLERLDAWLAQTPRKHTRRDVLTILADIARYEILPRGHDDFGRVRVLAAQSARTASAKHVFLAGMTEQSFPPPERAGRLCTEAEYRLFSRASDEEGGSRKASASAATRPQEEMLLFYGVVACAEESLTISYPALDDKAQELPPSPYVLEVRRTFGRDGEPTLRVSGPQLSPVPSCEPASPVDWRIEAVAKALEGDVRLLAGLFGEGTGDSSPIAVSKGSQSLLFATDTGLSQNKKGTVPFHRIDVGLRIVHARARRDTFGPADGLLISPAAETRFAERFGPRHLWSPSQWETYAACPYKFFLESVLGLEPLGDLELETDYQRRGSRLHDVLAAFHRQWKVAIGERTLPPEEEAAMFAEHLRNVVETRLSGPQAGIDAALVELDRRQIRKWAERHFEHQSRYNQLWSKLGTRVEPAHFEVRFGPPRAGEVDGDDPRSCNDAFALTVQGETVHVTGRIDRIDVARVGERVVFNVIDYKSGRKASLREEHIASGEHLQLPIYVAAAQALLFDGDAEPLAAGYWSMAGGFDAKGVLAVQHGEGDRREHWIRMLATVEERIGQFIAAIRRGEFPVFSLDDQCTSRCDFNTICRVTQIRSLGKTWQAEEPLRRGQADQVQPTPDT